MTLRIGPVTLAHPVLSAPIAGFTDRIFRDIVRDFGGCGLIYTEMVSAGGWVQGNIPPDRLSRVEDEARPLGVQLWDREEAPLEEAARRLVDLGITVIDLNFGCPKKRIMGTHAAGATLLRDPATVGRLVAATRRGAGGVPVTAKIRLGPSVHQRTAPAVARAAADNGAAAVTVHGRTAGDGYGVPCNREMIAEVVQAVDVPVIANGDVQDAASAVETVRRTGAAGVMVARGCLTRPWVFREIAAALAGEPVPAPPSHLEQRALLLRHHAEMIEREGERWGTVAMRKFAVRYLTGMPGARGFRDHICRAETPAEFREVVERFFPLAGSIGAPADLPDESCSAA
ncbi:tRNA-dihydrouridine synthase [bacterium]|nr:tRNA-dihydrouridine synthase [bacterium]